MDRCFRPISHFTGQAAKKEAKHKPGNTDHVNAVLQWMSETGYKPGLVGWIFSLRCQDFTLHFVQLKPKFKFCVKLFQVRKLIKLEVI